MGKRRLIDAGIVVSVFATAAIAVSFRPHGSMVAAWWPAAGLGVWLVLRQRERRDTALAVAAVLVATTLANMVVPGRPFLLSLVFGGLNAAEASVAAALFLQGGRPRALVELVDVRRLLVAATVGAALAATIAAPAVTVTYGDPLWRTWLSVFPSHASGQLLVLALVLAPREERRTSGWFSAVVLTVVLLAFAAIFWLQGVASVAFLPLAALVGATFRLRPRTVAGVVLLVATFVTFATATGHGPFTQRVGLSPGAEAALVQLYVICLIGLAAPLSVAIREREHALEVERAANAQLMDYARMRTDLLNGVTHELRTPLTSILGFTEVLSAGVLGDLTEHQADITRRVHRNGRRLLDLVDDLLAAAAFGSGEDPEEADREEVDLLHLVREAILQRACHGHPVEVTSPLPGTEPLRVLVDVRRVRRAVEQVVGNACRVSPPGRSVEVVVGRECAGDGAGGESGESGADGGSDGADGAGASWVTLTVTDHGCGIPADELPHVAEPFFRTRSSLAEARAGVGLGLALAQETALAHRGSLVLDSEVGRGTVVTLRLPPAPSARR